AELAAQHPGAEVRASTLEAFALALGASGAVGDLPVVTAEIGDPWIFGAGSDPVKVAAFREVLRARRHLPPGDARAAVDRHLLLAAEHTWGLDQKVWLPDDVRWDRAGLAALRATPEAVRFEGSWAEQRAYVDRAADALATADANPTAAGPDAALPAGAAAVGRVDRVAAAVPRWPMGPDGVPSGGFTPVEAGRPVTGAGWRVAVDPATGALAEATRTGSGRALADPDHLLGAFSYQSFDERDYERFFAGLTPSAEDEGWARWDNTKPGIDAAGARSGRWHPVPTGCWHASQQGGAWHTLLVRGACTGEASEALGAPAEVWSRWTWSTASDELELDLWWEDKPANRLPEATWCSFTPLVAEPERWTIDKLGQAVSPLDVVRRGGRALHAVGAGMAYDGPDGRLAIRTVDAPLVAPGRPGLLDADPPVPDLAGGFHVLLHDNCWGTNFPMWVEGPARFRFAISVGEVSPPRS
ncbi:MAG TPA: DUF5054 domain-containing protein, partial [Aquihabitans sp.]|nr:DUF5054 domain-containing protein [Aquihabitans sp.]